jgi:hypothetical protein
LLLQVAVSFAEWSPRPPTYEVDASDGKKHKTLYPKGGAVEVLQGPEGLASLSKDTSIVWIVQYYDVNCPHCWYFSAIYPALARAIASPTVRVASFMCTDDFNAAACAAAHVNGFPTVEVYNAKGPGSTHIVHVHNDGDIEDPKPAEAIAADLTSYSDGKITVLHPEVFQQGSGLTGAGTGDVVKPDGPPGKSGWTNEAYGSVTTRFHDAHIGMSRLLRAGYTNSSQYQAALEVVKFVGDGFGKDEAKIFSKLNDDLKAKPDMEPADFRAILKDWEQQFDNKWAFCKTGTTCGVWQLFHALSSLIVIKYYPIPVAEALPKIRFIVDKFMTCKVCRTHFLQSYDECLFGRCEILNKPDEESKSKALLLWLWRVHNAVSQRVINENPPHGGAVDRRWPAYKDCPGCWNVTVVNGASAALETFEGQTNNKQPVYDFAIEKEVFDFILFSYLGEDPTKKKDRLFELPAFSSISHPHAATSSANMVTYSVFAAVACMAIAFFVARRIGSKSSSVEPSFSHEELLESPEMLE